MAAYIEWHFQHRLGMLSRLRSESADLKLLGVSVLARLRQRGRGLGDSTTEDETLEGVPQQVIDRITSALRPGSLGNPFDSGFLQARNYVLWLFFLASGGRRNEIQAVKVSDVTVAMQTLFIRESKTIPREVPIGRAGALAFDSFVEEHWSSLSREARKRGFLFTDKDGRHLSPRQVNRVFVRIRRRVPDVPDFLTPHTVRRSWNDRFSEMVDRQPPEKRMPPEQEARVRNKLQGWTPQSEMGAKYGRRHLRRKADEIGEKLANELIERPRISDDGDR